MEIYDRDIHNDMIKPFENGGWSSVADSVTRKVLISDTILRLFIPQQVRKMTPKLLQICGCEIFIVPKDVKIDLDRFRKIIVSDL